MNFKVMSSPPKDFVENAKETVKKALCTHVFGFKLKLSIDSNF